VGWLVGSVGWVVGWLVGSVGWYVGSVGWLVGSVGQRESQSGTLGQVQKSRLLGDPEIRLYEPLESQVSALAIARSVIDD
jgi:hypothetical protein